MCELSVKRLATDRDLFAKYLAERYWSKSSPNVPVHPDKSGCTMPSRKLFGLGQGNGLCEFYFDPECDRALTKELALEVSPYDLYKDYGSLKPESGMFDQQGYARGLRGEEEIIDFLKKGGCLIGLIGRAHQSWTLNEGVVDIALAMAERKSERATPDECAGCVAGSFIREILEEMKAMELGKK